VHPASRPFPSSLLRYEYCREQYARTRPHHCVQIGMRHPTTRTNDPTAKRRWRNPQGLQSERKGCVFRSQQVLPQRALALKEIKNGLHHVGRYPDLKARVMNKIRSLHVTTGTHWLVNSPRPARTRTRRRLPPPTTTRATRRAQKPVAAPHGFTRGSRTAAGHSDRIAPHINPPCPLRTCPIRCPSVRRPRTRATRRAAVTTGACPSEHSATHTASAVHSQ